jgi:porin
VIAAVVGAATTAADYCDRLPAQPERFSPSENVIAPEPPLMPGLPSRLPQPPQKEDVRGEKEEEPEHPPGLLGYRLHGRGPISVEYIYTSELFANVHGGTRRQADYIGLLDLTLAADLQRSGSPIGGRFVILMQQLHGRGLTTSGAVEAYQVLSNIDAEPMTQVAEYYWERQWLDGKLFVRLGKQDANTDMAVVEPAKEFIHSSFGYHPTIPMPTYPQPSAGAFAALKLNEHWTFKIGVWDGQPQVGNWGFSGSGLAFSIFEINYHYFLGRGDRYPGRFHFGPWHHNQQPAEIDGPRIFSQNYGYHLEWEQRTYYERPGDDEDEQGLSCFLQYGYAPGDRNLTEEYLGAGLVYRGLLPRRNDDLLGAGVAWLRFSRRLADLRPETAVEMFYKARLSRYVVLQPELQYIAHPGGNGSDALVFGVRLELTL